MRCPRCGNDLFKGQFSCGKCGAIIELELAKIEADKQAKAEARKSVKAKKETKEK